MNDKLHDWKTGELLVVKADRLSFAITSDREATFEEGAVVVFLGFTTPADSQVPRDVFDEETNGKPTIVYRVLSPQGIVWREVGWCEGEFIEPSPDSSLLVVER